MKYRTYIKPFSKKKEVYSWFEKVMIIDEKDYHKDFYIKSRKVGKGKTYDIVEIDMKPSDIALKGEKVKGVVKIEYMVMDENYCVLNAKDRYSAIIMSNGIKRRI